MAKHFSKSILWNIRSIGPLGQNVRFVSVYERLIHETWSSHRKIGLLRGTKRGQPTVQISNSKRPNAHGGIDIKHPICSEKGAVDACSFLPSKRQAPVKYWHCLAVNSSTNSLCSHITLLWSKHRIYILGENVILLCCCIAKHPSLNLLIFI